MYIVKERHDGNTSITPFWCEVRANTLRDKINDKGGSAVVEKLRGDSDE